MTKEVKINRTWHGKASVRDYLVEDAMRKKQDLLIKCGRDIMTVEHKDLMKGKWSKFALKSKHGQQNYRLVDYDWKPEVIQPTLWKNSLTNISK